MKILILTVVFGVALCAPANDKLSAPKAKEPANGTKVPVKQNLKFGWTAVEGAQGYRVWFSANTRKIPLVWATIDGQVTEATISFEIAGDYKWYVVAVDQYDHNGDSSVMSSFTVVEGEVFKRSVEDTEEPPTGETEEPESGETDEPTGSTEETENPVWL